MSLEKLLVENYAAVISVAGAIISGCVAYIGNRRNAEHKAFLDQKNAESDARRDYEYDALKRLYLEVEPLRFQLIESLQSSHKILEHLYRIEQESIKEGSLPKGNYLKLSIAYHFLLPAVIFKLLSKRVNNVDLDVSKEIRLSYMIVRQYYLVFTHDAKVAQTANIEYTPYVSGWRTKRQGNPSRYRRQGFALGRLDNAIDLLTIRNGEEFERPITFGEFESLIDEQPEFSFNSPLGALLDLFDDFEIRTRPVLKRLLTIQYFLGDLLISSHRGSLVTQEDLEERLTSKCLEKALLFDSSEDGYKTPTETAIEYISDCLLSELEGGRM